jgi:solute carrier family 25 uncoupling protein 8/9
MTIPLDTSKVRLQIQGQKKVELGKLYKIKYKGMFHALKTIYLEEGVTSLWKGIMAGLQRQLIFAGLRIGLYPVIRDYICGVNTDPVLYKRILAGLLSGAIGIVIASPTDVVKVRLQAEGRKPIGTVTKYNGSFDAYKKIFFNEGVRNFYSGLIPNILRCSLMNSAELATYDQLKYTIVLKYSIDADNKLLHFGCAIAASFMAVILASPADVIKTRIMSVY